MQALNKLSVMVPGLVLAQTVSVFFHALFNQGAPVLIISWFLLLVFVLPVNLVIYYVLISRRHSQIQLHELFSISFFVHIIAIEPLFVFFEIKGEPDVSGGMLLLGFYTIGLVLAFLVSRLPKTFSFASIYRWMIVIPVFYAVLYFVLPPNAVEICERIAVGMPEAQVVSLVEREVSKSDMNYVNLKEKEDGGDHAIGFHTEGIGWHTCYVLFDAEGKVLNAKGGQQI